MIKEIKRTWSNCELDYVKEFLLHSESEVEKLPKCCIGSTALVCESGNIYVCGKDGAWKLKEDAMAEGGGVGGVSSWNDLTDKPFGTKLEQGVVLHIEGASVDSESGAIEPGYGVSVVGGEQYKVEYLDNVYTCVAQTIVDNGVTGFVLGNWGAIMGEEGTGEPFVVLCGSEVMIFLLDGSTSADMTITGLTEVVEELEEKYIETALTATKESIEQSLNPYFTINLPDLAHAADGFRASTNVGESTYQTLFTAVIHNKRCKANVIVSNTEYRNVSFFPFIAGSNFVVCGTIHLVEPVSLAGGYPLQVVSFGIWPDGDMQCCLSEII